MADKQGNAPVSEPSQDNNHLVSLGNSLFSYAREQAEKTIEANKIRIAAEGKK